MKNTLLTYRLSDGFVDHWLIAGPLERMAVDCETHPGSGVEITEPPVDLGPVSKDHPEIPWRYYRCREDHRVDLTANYPSRTCLNSWAYAQVQSGVNQPVVFHLNVDGAVEVQLNGQSVYRQDVNEEPSAGTVQFPAKAQAGRNEILVCFDQIGLRKTPYTLSLRITGLENAEITLPVPMERQYLALRQRLEELAEAAYLARYVYGYLDGDRYNKNEPVTLRFADFPTASLQPASSEITYRLQSLKGDIFQEGTKQPVPGMEIEMARSFPLRSGPHLLALLPPVDAYYLHNLRFERKLLFHIVRAPFSRKAEINFHERAMSTLQDAAERRTNSLYTEIARMELGRWDGIDRSAIGQAIERANRRLDGSVEDVLAFLQMLARFGKRKVFPKDLKHAISACICAYRFWGEDPVDDGMDFRTESRQILYHTCETLSGQMFPKKVFSCTGQKGRWHQARGETLAAAWLKQRGQYGFRDWDSPDGLEEIVAALSCLLELSDSEKLPDLAAVLLDKVLFSLATHSLQGAYGASSGKSSTASVFSARLSPVSGITRLMWGLGNDHETLPARVSLALGRNYQLPPLIAKIACDPIAGDTSRALWSKEHHALPDGSWSVNTVTYRTADFLLCSAQDYAPGQMGSQEHIWQATLGPDAVVFVNHPANMSEDDARCPNLWRGNGTLPRVAQWGDVLFAVHRLPENDWMGFTHAYFPVETFDEYDLENGWAFARKGSAYLALKAAKGYEFITRGQTAYRELRSGGKENIWVCHMGHALLDTDYAAFRQKILAMPLEMNDLSVQLTSIRGETLTFGWEGPLRVNGVEQPLGGYRHIENMYCTASLPADHMDIIDGNEGVRLKFEGNE